MNYIKEGWLKTKLVLDSINDLYSIEECKSILLDNDFYSQFKGKAKNRTMLKHYPKLYKSIYVHTKSLQSAFTKQKSYKWNYNFVNRMEFIKLNCNIELLKCKCGKKYTWAKYCRQCPEPKKTWLGRNHTKETKLKQRESTLNYIHTNCGQVMPRYNKSSIKVLEEYAKKLNITDLRHAENGGEFKVLGYFVDGYSPSKNIVFEYDEAHHYDLNGKLSDKDLNRQLEIERYLGCTFIRIKQ
jgi:hypothetical protein